MVILITILWIGFILFRAHNDSWIIKNGLKVSHAENAILSVIMASLMSFTATRSLWLVPMYLSMYWLVFDMVLNKLRGKELLYLGATAFLDKIFHNKCTQLTVKLICLGVSVVVYLVFKR